MSKQRSHRSAADRFAKSRTLAMLCGLAAVCGARIPFATAASGPAIAFQPAPYRLREVIVTATRRAEPVDKVPISISVMTRGELDIAGITDMSQLAAVTPGVTFNSLNAYGTPTANIAIRGVISRDGMPTTAVYLNDTPLLTRINGVVNFGAQGPLPAVFDMQRVEVLRGPQGTLFGASAEGGAVRFITEKPSLTTHSEYIKSELSYTQSGAPSYELGTAVGGPIDRGTLGYRASVYIRHDGGWIDRVQPLVGRPGFSHVDATNVNWDQTTQANAALTWKPERWIKVMPSLFYQTTYYNDSNEYEVAISNPSTDTFRFAHSQQLPASDPWAVPALKVQLNLGKVALTSITSYFWRHSKFQADYTQYQDYAFFGNPYPQATNDYATGYYGTFQNNIQEELRATSTDPSSRISWVAGIYASSARQKDQAFVVHNHIDQLIQQKFGQPIQVVLGQPLYLGEYVAYFYSFTPDLLTYRLAKVSCFKPFTGSIRHPRWRCDGPGSPGRRVQ